MARVASHIGGRERLEPTISKATPWACSRPRHRLAGRASSIGSASALRALADDCDADLDAFHERERAERDLDG